MTVPPESWEEIKELFDAALELEPARRPSFLQEHCRDLTVRAEVERLLSEHDEAGAFLSVPIIKNFASDFGWPEPPSLDAYRVLEMIGEGGMGQVWLADQTEPVRRRVAIKLIKVGMDTREVVARFESERQALALMDHPAIAKVFEAGATREGRPYFVMEYVPGIPITAYCDKHRLTTRERMELFIQVCEGVQHAHQKAIIHRDLKPSNILVSEIDGKPMPRIIDFGLAKATAHRLTDASMYTQIGAVLGTIDYMSPEQANSGGEDIDTRTDVYSLGVVLYQLLVGSLPLDLKKLAYEEVLHRLREEDVRRPSSRILARGEDSAITAQNRRTNPPSLMRQLRGDPDAVVLKALEKDRKRRYGSPSELATDIRKYLRNEPVAAHSPSGVYRARKYVQRHTVGVSVSAAAVVLLIGFAVTEAIQLRRITEERDSARRARDRADRITQFMTGMFKVSKPSESRGNTVTAREILDKASGDVDTSLGSDPELRAEMIYTMGNTYISLGLYPRSEQLFKRAAEIQRRVLGPENPETLRSTNALAWVLNDEGRYAEAEKLQRETLGIQRRVLGPEHPDTLRSMHNLAMDFNLEGRFAEAERLQRETLDIKRRVLGPDNSETLDSMNDLGLDLRGEGRYAEAENLDRETLDLRRRILGPEHPDTLDSMNNLALDLTSEDKFAEAEKLQQETLDIKRRILGPEHPETLNSMNNLALDLLGEGKYAEAERLNRETLDVKRRVLGPEHPETAVSIYNLACTLARENRHDEAVSLLQEAVAHGLPAYDVLGMSKDPDLKSLHGDPRFEMLIAEGAEGSTAQSR